MTTTVPGGEVLGATPVVRARVAAETLGVEVLTRWCADLLGGRVAYGAPGTPDPGWLAGRAHEGWGRPGELVGSARDYWPRVWAARTLLHVWQDLASADVVAALGDPSWRVREMAAKVAVRHEVAEAADRAADLLTDDTPRVRAAAARLLGVVGEHEHLARLEATLDDEEPAVRDAVRRSVPRLRERLDLPI